MSGTVILCSGQGGQSPSMFDLVADAPEAAAVFAEATRALGGRDPRGILRAADDELHDNVVAQVLCCTQALALWAIIGPRVPRPLTIAGYSAGELAAWAITGAIDLPTLFDLAVLRARFMDEATTVPSGLAGVIGLPRKTIDAICAARGLAVAIINGEHHFIIGGAVSGLELALRDAQDQGATRATRLPIRVASHTPALRAASDRFAQVLRERLGGGALPADMRLINGVDGTPVRRLDDGLAHLSAQISSTIDWAACMDRCHSARPNHVLELGPGDALARMFGAAFSGIPTRSASAFRATGGVVEWLRS